MRYLVALLLMLGSTSCALPPQTTSTPVSAPAAGYEPLALLAGRWTLMGREGSFVETCRWYDGGFHVICTAENKRPDGSTGKTMSILGYLPGNDSFTYHGIGNTGRNETMTGSFRGGIFEFISEIRREGSRVRERVRMGPFTGREVPFFVETAVDDAAWKDDGAFTYVKLD